MTLRVRPVAPHDRHALVAFLRAGGVADAWMLHSLDVGGLQGFVGAFDGGALVGVAILRRGAASAASLSTTEATRVLVPAVRERGPWFSVVGPERPCRVLSDGLLGRAAARVDRVQVLMVVDDPGALGEAHPGVRPAAPRDLEALVPIVTAYRIEDGLSRPDDDPQSWVRAHVRERIEQRMIHVVEEDGRIVFTGAFNFLGAAGAGVGGIYTVPERRGHGIAARATSALCHIGFAHGPSVSLHVDERNLPALRCYERAGLRAEGLFRLTFR